MTGTHQQEIAQGWQRTSPLAVIASGLKGLQQAILPIVAVMFGAQSFDIGPAMAIGIAVMIVAVNMLAAWMQWWRLRYRVGESDIRVEKGVVSRQGRSVPYERIQDVSLEQALVPRLLGLVEVRFETGAGGKDELSLAYVAMAEGERLREVVRDQREMPVPLSPSGDTSALAPAAAPADAGELLFAMGPMRLLTFGFYEFSLVVFGVLAGAAQQLEFLLPFDIWDVDGWETRLAGPGAWLAGLGVMSQVIGVIIGVVLVALVGMATGIVRTMVRDWGFRLERTPKGFRRRRGLFTHTDVVMPVHRVQAVIVRTGLVRRLGGWHALSFVSLAQDAKSANHVVAPFAQMDEIAPIVRAAGFGLPSADVDWHRPDPKYHFDRALLSALPVALAGFVLLFFDRTQLVAWLLFALAGFELARHHFLWRFERHAIDARQIVTRRGWLVPQLEIADRVKLHSVEIAQGPIARRRGYADLRFGLAGGTLAFKGLPLAEAQAMRAGVLASIAAVDFSRLPR